MAIWQGSRVGNIWTIVSSVQFMPGSNHVLFCPGNRVKNEQGFGGKIIELDYVTKKVVLQLSISAGNRAGFHKAKRMSVYPEKGFNIVGLNQKRLLRGEVGVGAACIKAHRRLTMMRKLLKIAKRMMIITLTIVTLLIVFTFFYMRQAKFGKAPSGSKLALVQKSPNFKDGKFKIINYTPEIAEGYTMPRVVYAQFFKKAPRRHPAGVIPSIKTDLLKLPVDTNILIWFGHSSYYMQIDGKRILVDPVFSGNASPIPGTNKSFNGTDIYTVADLPQIDYLFISHDHYDRVDFETLTALRSKTKKVVCGLGVGSHLEHWGFSQDQVIEKDWQEKIELDTGFIASTAPARHFSGRGFSRKNTLWLSYIPQTPTMKIYIGGDSGYDTHYADIGNRYGPIDLAILDNGQYDLAWRYIHNLPHEVVKAAQDLKAKRLFPVHFSKFVMANHPWDEPLIKVDELSKDLQNPIPLVTPIIGEPVFLANEKQKFKQWWIDVK